MAGMTHFEGIDIADTYIDDYDDDDETNFIDDNQIQDTEGTEGTVGGKIGRIRQRLLQNAFVSFYSVLRKQNDITGALDINHLELRSNGKL